MLFSTRRTLSFLYRMLIVRHEHSIRSASFIATCPIFTRLVGCIKVLKVQKPDTMSLQSSVLSGSSKWNRGRLELGHSDTTLSLAPVPQHLLLLLLHIHPPSFHSSSLCDFHRSCFFRPFFCSLTPLNPFFLFHFSPPLRDWTGAVLRVLMAGFLMDSMCLTVDHCASPSFCSKSFIHKTLNCSFGQRGSKSTQGLERSSRENERGITTGAAEGARTELYV